MILILKVVLVRGGLKSRFQCICRDKDSTSHAAMAVLTPLRQTTETRLCVRASAYDYAYNGFKYTTSTWLSFDIEKFDKKCILVQNLLQNLLRTDGALVYICLKIKCCKIE